jgi:hypothetical protein
MSREMRIPLDEAYVQSRRVLLDALEALGAQRRAVVLAGAQAIYLQTGDSRLPAAEYTTDGDLAIDQAELADTPVLEELMEGAGFKLSQINGTVEPGIWEKQASIRGVEVAIPVDLIVPQGAASSAGRRGARLGAHGRRAARKILGLEGVLIDNRVRRVGALDRADRRSFDVKVAGIAALLVAKLHKLRDRAVDDDRTDRLLDKDASDIVQLMRMGLPDEIAVKLRFLSEDPIAGPPTRDAMGYLQDLFGSRAGRGISMAADALRNAVPEERIRAICLAYARAIRESPATREISS